jgi:hypothetical protein
MATITPDQIAAVFRQATAAYPAAQSLDFTRLAATDKTIYEKPDGLTTFSDALLDACFPPGDATIDYFHYTTLDSFRKIVDSAELRLYWLHKRLPQYEFRPFCDAHGLTGYLDIDPLTGEQYLEEMSRNLFYISLTSNAASAHLWDAFGDGGRGVRLRLRLQPVQQRMQLRHMAYYSAAQPTLFRHLMDSAQKEFNRHFIPSGLSRAGAFYLPTFLDIEMETRLLSKRFALPAQTPDPWAIVRRDGDDEYLPLPIGIQNDFCFIDLVHIEGSDYEIVRKAKEHLNGSAKFRNIDADLAQ